MQSTPSERQILSVSQLNRSVRHLIETQLPLLWVEGEISNFARPGSGHWYLTLKDDQAQVRCAMFNRSNQRVRFTPANGDAVRVRCRASLYEARGEFQLIAEHLEPAGAGALRAAFEALRSQLKKAGARVTALDDAIAEENGEQGGRGPTQADILIDLALHTSDNRLDVFVVYRLASVTNHEIEASNSRISATLKNQSLVSEQ